MTYVTPTRDLAVRPGQHVSVEGRIYHPYLVAWGEQGKVSAPFSEMWGIRGCHFLGTSEDAHNSHNFARERAHEAY